MRKKTPTFSRGTLGLRSKTSLSLALIASMVVGMGGVHAAGSNALFEFLSQATTLVDAALNQSAVDNQIVVQDAEDDANQDIVADSNVDVTSEVNGTVTAENDGSGTQTSSADQSNQNGLVDAGANSLVGLVIDALGLGNGVYSQTAAGTTNQNSESAMDVNGDISADLGVDSNNEVDVAQDSTGDQGNQDVTAGLDATSNVLHILNLTTLGDTFIEQVNEDTGSANQNIWNNVVVNNFIDAITNVNTYNTLTVEQNCGDNCNQNVDAGLWAMSDVAQLIAGDASAINILGQSNANGLANQNIDNESSVLSLLLAGQNVETSNFAVVTQDADGNANQNAHLNLGSLGLALQGVTSNASDVNLLSQENWGDKTNQNIENDSDAASIVLADQGLWTGNTGVVAQVNGDGNVNQNASQNLEAVGGGLQLVFGPALSLNVIGQTSSGLDTNQNVDNDSSATDVIFASQDVLSGNSALTVQANDDGDVNQNSHMDLGSEVFAGQVAVGNAAAINLIDQNSDAGLANQNIENTGVAIDAVAADQTAVGFNDATNVQLNDDGNANQNFHAGLDVDVEAGQLASGDAQSINLLGQQNNGGSANQDMDNTSVAIDAVSAGQVAVGANDLVSVQVNDDGNVNQNTEVDGAADVTAGQVVVGPALSLTAATQVNDGGSGNQNFTGESLAADVVDADQVALASNAGLFTQSNDDGDANQNQGVTFAADTDAFQLVFGNAAVINDVAQVNIDGDANQNVEIGAAAIDAVDADQTAVASNVALSNQENGDGMANQNWDAGLAADTDGVQVAFGDATNVAGALQVNDNGMANQNADIDGAAISGVAASQTLAAANVAVGNQENGDGEANQNAELALASDVDGVQVAGAEALNAAGTLQFNQDGEANQNTEQNGVAVAGTDADQTAVGANVAVMNQENDGIKTNQNALLGLEADVDADQDLTSLAANGQGALQSNTGIKTNQNAEQDGAAVATLEGDQVAASTNVAVLNQDADGSFANQNAELLLGADTDASQTAQVAAVNGQGVEQSADGEYANQNAEQNGAAVALGDLGQTVVSGNVADVSQTTDFPNGSASQNVELGAGSTADGEQTLEVAAINGQGIVQDANGVANQNAEQSAGTVALGGANQDIVSGNDIDVDQNIDGNIGAGAQAIEIGASADANGEQNVDVVGITAQGIVQDPDQGNQNAEQSAETLAAGTGDQTVTAENNIDASQDLTLNRGAGAQYMLIEPTADAGASQNVDVAGATAQGIDQDAGGDGMVNQNGEQDADTAVVADADQDVSATNNAILVQHGDVERGALAQTMIYSPTTTATGSQDVDATGVNAQGIDQDASGTGSSNQNAHQDSDLAIDADADQSVAAETNTIAVQDCDITLGACAQYAEIAPTTTASGEQNVAANGTSEQTASQESNGDAANQNSEQDADTSVAVDADQDVSATTNDVVFQTCTPNGGVCAQAVFIGGVTEAEGEQNIEATSENTSDIDQTANGDAANQNASTDQDATTDVTADENVAAESNTGVVQESTGDSTNQNAEANTSTNSNAVMNITAGSSNNNTITQTQN